MMLEAFEGYFDVQISTCQIQYTVHMCRIEKKKINLQSIRDLFILVIESIYSVEPETIVKQNRLFYLGGSIS